MFREVLDRNPGITGAAAGRIIWDVLSYWVMANVDKYGKRKGREIPK
jgi:hypothetical protein